MKRPPLLWIFMIMLLPSIAQAADILVVGTNDTSSINYFQVGRATADLDSVRQSFYVNGSAPDLCVRNVALYMESFGCTGSLIVGIQNDTGTGVPNNIYENFTLLDCSFGSSAWRNFTLQANVKNGTLFHIVADGTWGPGVNFVGWNHGNHDIYPGKVSFNGTTCTGWTCGTTGQDSDFIVYAEEAACTTPPPPVSTNFTVTVTDEWNGSTVLGFNVSVNGSTYQSNSTGFVTTALLVNDTHFYDVFVWGPQNYFNRTYTSLNISTALSAELHQAEACFNATSKVSGSLITPDFFLINSVMSSSCFNISAGTYSVQANKTGWFQQNQTFSIPALFNGTYTVANLSYANLTIYVYDGTTNASLSNYDVSLSSISYPTFSESKANLTNGSFYLIDGVYTVNVTVPGYATTPLSSNVTVSGHKNASFSVYKANSVTITIRDEISNNLITDNITIRWTGSSNTWENSTTTGSLFAYNLTPDNYQLLFYGSNYSTRTYQITVGNLSTQFLTAYMIATTYNTILTIQDQDTAVALDNVTIVMYKQINATWSAVESKFSDITGKAQFYYDPIASYRFNLARTGYNDLIFYLNPILFSTYTISMQASNTLNYTVDYDDLSILYTPDSLNANQNQTFDILFSSPSGMLTTYSAALIYPGGSSSASGNNAAGQQFTLWANLTNVSVWDTPTLYYNYTTSLSGERTFTKILPINTNVTIGENTFLTNKDKTYGLGAFERMLIVTIIVIFTVGIASLVGQSLPGFGIGLFLFAYLVYIGFADIWAILPSMFLGFLYMVWKSGGF